MRVLRLKKKKEISGVLKTGRRAHAESVTIVYFPAKETRAAVCVGKKFGKSVRRNRIKRLLREAFRTNAHGMKPCAILLIPKVAEEYSYARFERDLRKLFKREKLFES